ncbi:MAG: winged helix-turn-helix domain-containing protein [Candidatus Thermoplasmatota archaeon]|jgi:DNA-binding MarR family transcriptional regulator
MQTHQQSGLDAAPASVQVVIHQLTGHSPMTGKQIREATGLPRRTVYTALRRLREMGLLQERSSLKDTRQTYFWLDDAANWTTSPTL